MHGHLNLRLRCSEPTEFILKVITTDSSNQTTLSKNSRLFYAIVFAHVLYDFENIHETLKV